MAITGVQIKQWNITAHLSGWLRSKKDDNKAGEDMEDLDDSHIAGKNVKYYRLSGKQVGSFLKNKKDLHTIVHRGFIHNSQTLETAHTPRRMVK